MRWRRALAGGVIAGVAMASALPAQERGAAALAPLIAGLDNTMRVLMIGAHPDDEDTQLLAWLARGRKVETAYLSLTRGDGGQNIIGNELGDALGAIRTEELLAARRLDGARQYFTRAWDFGFSKNAAEAFTQWNRDSLTRDVLTVVRAFRPHVIVSVFTGTPSDGHGQHQAAGILARDAYDRSGDHAIAAGATGGQPPWTVAKFYRGALFRNQDRATIRMNVGEYDHVLGRSYAQIAAESRSQHRSQAMGTLQPRGVRFDQLIREAARTGPADASRERSLFDGLDTTWARFDGVVATPAQRRAVRAVPGAIARVRRTLDLVHPAALITPLGQLQRLLGEVCGYDVAACARPGVPSERLADLAAALAGARARVREALVLAAGIVVESNAEREIVAAGDSVRVDVALYNRGPLYLSIVEQLDAQRSTLFRRPLAPDSMLREVLWAGQRVIDQPWWMADGRTGAMFHRAASPVDEAARTRGQQVSYTVEVQGARFDVAIPYSYRYADAVRGEVTRAVTTAPAITVTLDRVVAYARANAPLEQIVTATVRSHARDTREVDVSIRLPDGLRADAPVQRVRLAGWQGATAGPGGNVAGGTQVVRFRVQGRLSPGRHAIDVEARHGGEVFTSGYVPVEYEHIRTQRLYRPSRLDISAVDVAVPEGLRVGYVPGVGDEIAQALMQLGVGVTVLDPATIGLEDLSRFGAVVWGPRAYEAHAEPVAAAPRLLEYARGGGTLVVQYGQYEMTAGGIMPYPITLGRPADRVTVEQSPVTIMDTAARVLSYPNRITDADFAGWVQDRSLYMPRTFDAAYQAPLGVQDPGEPLNRGGVLVAPLGQGTYVYTTLAFFRQLPSGVPGAARLWVNLLSARAARVTQ